MPSRRARRLVLLLVCWLTACNEESTNPTGCPGHVVLDVSTGSTPTFTWTTGCEATALTVFDRTGAPLWAIAPLNNRILSPVTYGVVPTGVREIHPPEALQTGTEYNLFLKWLAGTDTLAATFPFTP